MPAGMARQPPAQRRCPDDSRRLHQAIAAIRRYPGRDRLVIRVSNEIEFGFPSETTGYGEVLARDLQGGGG